MDMFWLERHNHTYDTYVHHFLRKIGRPMLGVTQAFLTCYFQLPRPYRKENKLLNSRDCPVTSIGDRLNNRKSLLLGICYGVDSGDRRNMNLPHPPCSCKLEFANVRKHNTGWDKSIWEGHLTPSEWVFGLMREMTQNDLHNTNGPMRHINVSYMESYLISPKCLKEQRHRTWQLKHTLIAGVTLDMLLNLSKFVFPHLQHKAKICTAGQCENSMWAQ